MTRPNSTDLIRQLNPPPQYRRSQNSQKSDGIREPAVKGDNQENPDLGLENGRQYLAGGGERRDGIGGDGCIAMMV